MLSFVFALWFPNISFFFVVSLAAVLSRRALRDETQNGCEGDYLLRCSRWLSLLILPQWICLVRCMSSCGSFASQFGRVSPIVNIFHCSMNKYVQPSMNKHELHLTPACLPTFCCLATFPLSEFLHLHCFQATAQTPSTIYVYVYVYVYVYTWIYENIAPEILPYVSFPCEIFLFIYWFFFFLHFSFDPKSISRKHTLADIYKIKIVFYPPPPPSLPPWLFY